MAKQNKNETEELVLDVTPEDAANDEEAAAKPKKKAKKPKKVKPALPEGQMTLSDFMKEFAVSNPDVPANRNASWVRDQLRKGAFNDDNGNPTEWITQDDNRRWVVRNVPGFTELLLTVIAAKAPKPKAEKAEEEDPDMGEVI